jgi:uncharacterized membrane protein
MDECLSPPWPVTWPQNQLTDQALTDDRSCERLAAFAGVVTVTGNTRRLTHICAGLLAAVLVGAATVTSALALRGGCHDRPVPAVDDARAGSDGACLNTIDRARRQGT